MSDAQTATPIETPAPETPATPAIPPGFVEAEWVCTGKTILHGGGQGIGFRDLATGETSAFKPTATLRRYRSGGVYRVLTSPTSARFHEAHRGFVRLHDDASERRAWQLREQTLDVEARLDREYKRAFEDDDQVRRALDPLRRLYHGRDRVGKLAMEVVLLQHLRNPIS